jgi:hypothetical protein
MNKDAILKQMQKPYKKIRYEDHVNEKFQTKGYFKMLNISQARMRFKLNSGMTPTVRMNFPSDTEFTKQLWTCSGCTSGETGGEVVGCRDTQTHIMVCPGYADIRQDKNLSEDKDLVTYFSEVIKKRLEMCTA